MYNLHFKSTVLLLLMISFLVIGCLENVEESAKYLNQKPPSFTPEIFAPGIVSKVDQSEFGSVFSKDGLKFYYGIDVNRKTEIWHSQFQNGSWTSPVVLLSHEHYGYNDPFLSPNEDRLYYISNRALDGSSEPKDIDIWFSNNISGDWTEPVNGGEEINSSLNEYYISFTNEGTIYFSSNKNATKNRPNNFDIYYSKWQDNSFLAPVVLDESINTNAYEADVFVSPDESYMIFCAIRSDGLGQGDLYISFRTSDGEWPKAQNMGDPINSIYHELCPFVTQDGKYLFFTSNEDIYWVDALIIENYR